MFTRIIEAVGRVEAICKNQSNVTFTLSAEMASELKIDQSVAHNGVCLTVIDVNKENNTYQVTAIDETLKKTNLGNWETGTCVNLERCMPANGRFDGHIVQGHVDETAKCIMVEDEDGSWRYTFQYAENSKNMTVEKGSITVNGVSLTVVDSGENTFSVAIIPYTYYHTQFQYLKPGDTVNLEFDIVGKYVQKILALRG